MVSELIKWDYDGFTFVPMIKRKNKEMIAINYELNPLWELMSVVGEILLFMRLYFITLTK